MSFGEIIRRVRFLRRRGEYRHEFEEEMRLHRALRARQMAENAAGGDEPNFAAARPKLRAIPRVESVTLMGNRIASGWSNNTSASVDGKPPLQTANAAMRWNAVGPDFSEPWASG